jgi:hypothetical protein
MNGIRRRRRKNLLFESLRVCFFLVEAEVEKIDDDDVEDDDADLEDLRP